MKYSVSWLNELAGTELSAEEMAELFTRHSFEVEEIEKGGILDEHIVIGRVEEISKHPNANRLRVTKTNVGEEHGGNRMIVCGSPNVAVGQIVAVAMPGAVLPDGTKIQKSKIRDVVSEGMICGADELGFSEETHDIWVSKKDISAGTLAQDVFGEMDEVIELDILASRGHDALSHVGIARELRVIVKSLQKQTPPASVADVGSHLPFAGEENPDFSPPAKGESRVFEGRGLEVSIQNPDLCHRYMGVVLENIDNTQQTPDWMKSRLESCNINTINLVTDVTNYVMLEMGQPLHAFDFGKIKSELPTSNTQSPRVFVSVRKAKAGEELALLDGQTIELNEADLVIANEEKPLALAGVMGGLESATEEETSSILLEGAWFDPVSVRKTRMRHKIITESSHRFERNPDENGVENAMKRAVGLLEELSGANVVSCSDIYPVQNESREIAFSPEACESLLGMEIERDRMKEILKSIGCTMVTQEKTWRVTVPTFRKDLLAQEDLVEEVGRIFGYDMIKEQPMEARLMTHNLSPMQQIKVFSRDALVGLGYDEVLTYSFYGEDMRELFSLEKERHFTLANPLNPDQKYVRVRVLANMLKAVATNIHMNNEVRVFEIGKTYERDASGAVLDFERLAMITSTNQKQEDKELLLQMKGDVEILVERIAGEKPDAYPLNDQEDTEVFHPTQSMDLAVGGALVGFVGMIHPFVAKKCKLPQTTVLTSLDLEALSKLIETEKYYEPLGKYPAIMRDISLLVPKNILARDVEEIIDGVAGEVLRSAEIFDVFEKEGERSLAFHLVFGHSDCTLSGDEAQEIMDRIEVALEEKGVKMRK